MNNEKINLHGVFEFWAYDPDGNLKWYAKTPNLVVNEGRNNILDVMFHASTQTTTWYIGLKNAGTPAAGDTLASHATWTENTNYTGNRQEFVEAAASSQSITNSASPASFAIDTDSQTIAGAFLASVATGTTGILFSAADFTGGDQSLNNGDTLNVTYTINS